MIPIYSIRYRPNSVFDYPAPIMDDNTALYSFGRAFYRNDREVPGFEFDLYDLYQVGIFNETTGEMSRELRKVGSAQDCIDYYLKFCPANPEVNTDVDIQA